MSDTSGVYEIILFSEILSRSREFLEVGKALLLNADAEIKDDQLRLTVQDVKPLEESLISKVHEIRLQFDNTDKIFELKDILQKSGEGKSVYKIQVYSPATQKYVTILLKGYYNFTPEIRGDLYKIAGLKSLVEG